MIRAATYLKDPECIFIGTNPDEQFPMPHLTIPGAGAVLRAVETTAGRNALVMGKPSPAMCADLIAEHNIIPERTLMIGDRCNTDILLGTRCGFQTLMVESGIHKTKDVQDWIENGSAEDKEMIPDIITGGIGDLLPYLK